MQDFSNTILKASADQHDVFRIDGPRRVQIYVLMGCILLGQFLLGFLGLPYRGWYIAVVVGIAAVGFWLGRQFDHWNWRRRVNRLIQQHAVYQLRGVGLSNVDLNDERFVMWSGTVDEPIWIDVETNKRIPELDLLNAHGPRCYFDIARLVRDVKNANDQSQAHSRKT